MNECRIGGVKLVKLLTSVKLLIISVIFHCKTFFLSNISLFKIITNSN